MWLIRSWSIGLIAAISLLAEGASKAEPVKIRVSWIAPLSNWASLLMEKKELARHMGQSYILRAGPLHRNAAKDHGARQQRA